MKPFFYYTRRERRGILVLTGLIVAVVLGTQFYLWQRHNRKPGQEELRQQALAEQEYADFIASIREKEKAYERRTSTYDRIPIPGELAAFNPNTADSLTFRRLGLPGWMARNILRYREKGGKFRRAEDFKKIYGLTEEQYKTLLPYISIPPEDTVRRVARIYNPPAPRDTLLRPYKYPAGTVIDLNKADTTELKKIPGIGSGIARLIAGYRQRLGGFYRIEQLEEIHLDYRQLTDWFTIDARDIQRINLNQAGVGRLKNHPYINFYQAKAIVEYRRKKGNLKNLKVFALYEEFSEEDLERIGHYVCFE